MKSLPKVMLFGSFGVAAFTAMAALLTSTVTYHPFGVPEGLRDRYRDNVAELERRSELAKQVSETTRPVAVCERKSFDFGMVDPHSTHSHEFTVRNDGELPLQLQVLETSCKCAIGKLGQELIAPGEQTSVTLTWNTGKQAELYKQTALVATNDPLNKELMLEVKGVVRAKLIAPESIELQKADIGQPSKGSFYVYSQLWDNFLVADVTSDLSGFQWSAEPVAPDDIHLVGKEAVSAWKVKVSSSGNSKGVVRGTLKFTIDPSDGSKAVTRSLLAEGKVRAPINFYSPEIHYRDGLDIGTVVSGQEHLYHLTVRSRGVNERKLDVLDVKPEELEASLKPLGQPGSYRLTLRVPKDCPMVMFNSDQEHGYVQVGDPDDETFSNWFPVMGAVVTLDN